MGFPGELVVGGVGKVTDYASGEHREGRTARSEAPTEARDEDRARDRVPKHVDRVGVEGECSNGSVGLTGEDLRRNGEAPVKPKGSATDRTCYEKEGDKGGECEWDQGRRGMPRALADGPRGPIAVLCLVSVDGGGSSCDLLSPNHDEPTQRAAAQGVLDGHRLQHKRVVTSFALCRQGPDRSEAKQADPTIATRWRASVASVRAAESPEREPVRRAQLQI